VVGPDQDERLRRTDRSPRRSKPIVFSSRTLRLASSPCHSVTTLSRNSKRSHHHGVRRRAFIQARAQFGKLPFKSIEHCVPMYCHGGQCCPLTGQLAPPVPCRARAPFRPPWPLSWPSWHDSARRQRSERRRALPRTRTLCNFPRIPLSPRPEILRASARLGARIADLLDPDEDVPGVTPVTSPIFSFCRKGKAS